VGTPKLDSIESRTVAKVTRRLLPFLILCYFVAYLDRVNVSFAALTMNKALGISAAAFGFGAGVFFLAYFVFEVPSNLLLERFGARKWIARIMVTWGILSGAMALIGGETGFYVVRLLLGAAEAGFFPGIIFYLTLWFPAAYRARVLGYFMAAIPLSSLIGAPVSGYILGMNGILGLAGWQWLFIIEAAPSVILGLAVLAYLTDRPAQATWLEADERAWLVRRLAEEQIARERARTYSVMSALLNPRVLALSLVYFGVVAALYGVSFFLPQIVKAFGLSDVQTGYVTAIPFLAGTISMVFWGLRSDRHMERRGHIAFSLLLAGGGLLASTVLPDPTLKMLAISVSACGIFASIAVFWTLPTAFLSGAASAAGIAIINAIGNLSGFVGPYAMGAIKDFTGSFNGGLLCIGATPLISMAIVLLLRHDTALEASPATLPAE
jgi:D-galactonate transporter